ncbi:MAG TPA: hypothetical protein VHK68_00790 [Gemmatimonadales bacterium]|jgi:hypothetical protein|nr:hypothetical protein [Gemmatimonadales bacterium]
MAYLTATILKQESTWWFTAWQPQITNTTDFDTWIGTIVSRAANWVKWRVGATNYATSDTVLQGLLQEAELARGQYYLLLASAAIADTSDDATLQPFLQSGPKLLADAKAYDQMAKELTAPYAQAISTRWARPGSTLSEGVDASVPDFDETVQWEAPFTP